MSVVAAIHQPNFLPWVGYFSKMLQSDVFVLLDNVQLSRGSFTNRVRIKAAGATPWLTIPFRHSGSAHYPDICDTQIDYTQPWPVKHVRTLTQAYARAPHARAYLPRVAEILAKEYSSLAALNHATIAFLAEELAVNRRMVSASELGVGGHRNELLVAICKAVGADTYLVGQGAGLTYTDEEYFGANGIVVRRQQFTHPTYRQLHGDFVAGLSALDLLLNEGQAAGTVLRDASRSVHAL